MLTEVERAEIERLWWRKLEQEAQELAPSERHRNLEPDSAEYICALAAGLNVKRILEIGGSSGISTIALATAARKTTGKLISIEIEPTRQAEARQTIRRLGLSEFVEFILGDAANVVPKADGLEFVLIDCEKEDYIRFFDALRLAPRAVVVADNILSHNLTDYVVHARARGDSMTLPIGKGLEVTLLSPV